MGRALADPAAGAHATGSLEVHVTWRHKSQSTVWQLSPAKSSLPNAKDAAWLRMYAHASRTFMHL